MATYSLTPTVRYTFRNPFRTLVQRIFPRPDPNLRSDDRTVARDLMKEAIWNNPGTFANELDIQFMIQSETGRS